MRARGRGEHGKGARGKGGRGIASGALAAALAAGLLLGAAPGAEAQQRIPQTISALERNAVVATEGVVARVNEDGGFRLRDETGEIEVRVGPDGAPVDLGERVAVSGAVSDGLIRELIAWRIERADGTVLRFPPR
ncbi:MAG: OB-fold nucleic acid binding domain-containing protein [Alphaproteobacteria bacterium]|nr:OB-fold nucleic acid binding domain-containing protein [Alphaproteobacteria bacterium]